MTFSMSTASATNGGTVLFWMSTTPPQPPDEAAGAVSWTPRGPMPSPLSAFKWEPSVHEYDPLGDILRVYDKTCQTTGEIPK